jgi:hypothetical protein
MPFLICCAVGRDRTGIMVACLLDLLDVTDAAIGADYAESDSFDPHTGRSSAATIVELLHLVRHCYGSTLRMLTPFNVTEEVIGALRTALLVYET